MIELKVLGGLDLSGPEGQAQTALLAQPKRLALLAYLARSPSPRFVRRDTLIGVFWSELDAEHARNALSQALRFLRRQLGASIILRRGDEEIALDHDALACDANRFEHACRRREHARAVELYQGEFLAGFFISGAGGFERWLDEQRAHLARLYSRALEGAAEQHVQAGHPAQAAECWRLRAAADPHDPFVAMKLMSALAAAGDRPGAIEHARAHAQRLMADLDAEPDPAVASLADGLRLASEPLNSSARASVHSPSPGALAGPPRVESDTAPDLPEREAAGAVTIQRPGPGRTKRAMRVTGLVLSGLILSVLAIRPNPGAHSKRVVVAVFEDATGDTSLARLGVMAADWITQGLQKTGLVDVVPSGVASVPGSSTGAGPAAGQRMEALRELARVTAAQYVVNGTMYLVGENLRFQAQIIEASSLHLVAAPAAVLVRRDEQTRGIQELRQRVMASLASVLDPRVAGWAATASNPPSLAAFSEFQAGLDGLVRHHDSRAAIAHLRRAADADSSYVVPRLWMIDALMRIGRSSAPSIDSVLGSVERLRAFLAPADALLLDRFEAIHRNDGAAASRASLKLVALAPSSYFVQMLAEDVAFANGAREAVKILSRLDSDWPLVRDWQAYWALLADELHALGDFSRELNVARRARAISPELRRFKWLECRALAAMGRVVEVQKLMGSIGTRPLEDPRDYGGDFGPEGLLRNVGLELRAHGHHEAGRTMLERANAWLAARASVRDSDVNKMHHRMLMLDDLGRSREAIALAIAVLDSAPGSSMPRAVIGRAAVALGDTARAREELSRLTRSDVTRDRADRLYEAAKIAAALGEHDGAIDLLRRAFADGRRHTFWDHLATGFAPLRGLAAYQQLMRPRG